MLTRLLDRCGPTGSLKPSGVRARVDAALARVFVSLQESRSPAFLPLVHGDTIPGELAPGVTIVLDARGFPPEGPDSLGRAVIEL